MITLRDVAESMFPLKDDMGFTEITLKVSPEFMAALPQLVADDNTGVSLPETGESLVINVVTNTGNKNNKKYPIREIVIVK